MYINYNFNTNYVTLDHSFLVDFYLFKKKSFTIIYFVWTPTPQ